MTYPARRPKTHVVIIATLDEWSGVGVRDVDIARIATLHCLLTGDLSELARLADAQEQVLFVWMHPLRT